MLTVVRGVADHAPTALANDARPAGEVTGVLEGRIAIRRRRGGDALALGVELDPTRAVA